MITWLKRLFGGLDRTEAASERAGPADPPPAPARNGRKRLPAT
jgi:hypothetical protein